MILWGSEINPFGDEMDTHGKIRARPFLLRFSEFCYNSVRLLLVCTFRSP
jgi:hypothetical protein